MGQAVTRKIDTPHCLTVPTFVIVPKLVKYLRVLLTIACAYLVFVTEHRIMQTNIDKMKFLRSNYTIL